MLEERGIKINVEPEEEPTKESEVFYNDDMILNRDISVSALKTYRKDQNIDLKVLDALSGSGIRGLRYLKDVPGLEKVTMNDTKPEAEENIRENLGINDLPDEKTEVTGKDANVLMTERRKGYHYIDLDPFGSPARFLDSTARSLKHDSFVGITATDLATLCGTYVKTCRRRYSTWVKNMPYHHEVGLRVLIMKVFNSFAVHDKVFDPKLCYAKKHYYRIFGEVRETKKGVNRSLDKIGFITACRSCGYRNMVEEREHVGERCPKCGENAERLGPLWIGKTGRKGFIKNVRKDLEEKGIENAVELVSKLEKESEIKKPFYDTHNIGNITGMPAVRRKNILGKLEEKGYNAVETHFSPTGIKTNAPIEDIVSISKELNRHK